MGLPLFGLPLLGTLVLLGAGMLGLLLVPLTAVAGAAVVVRNVQIGRGRHAVGGAGAKLAYMTDVLLLLWPSPRTWPSSCITAISKSYCYVPTCVGSAPGVPITMLIDIMHPLWEIPTYSVARTPLAY
jgi:hypothetical protein